ncbi:MAG: chorismate synthase, partial [Coriobacteriia bacterium]|nr:chorismate synthase [Coriobacteriia bacterium]
RIGRVADSLPDDSRQTWQRIAALDFPAWQAEALSQEVQEAQQAGDSVGGSVEVRAFGVPGGLGEPFFGSMESSIASLLFSVPAIKSVEFGDGSELATMRGSQANDQLTVEDGRITALSNHNGGILGGISNGAPIVVRAAIKPTPSIAREQQSVDAATMQPTRLSIEGRHDPCVAVRAVPVIEAVVAICILDRLLVAARPQAFIQNLGG